jgi:putative membrane protein
VSTSASTVPQPADKEHDVHPVTLTPVVSAKDVEFTSAVTNNALNKVNTGKMALEKSVNTRVKNFATMLVNDHTKLGEELNQVAKIKRSPCRHYQAWPRCARPTVWL